MEIIGDTSSASHTPSASPQPVARQRRRDNSSALNIKEMGLMFLHRWYWFVLSLAVCGCLAFLFIAKTVPSYQRTVTLMLRDESKGSNMQANVDLTDLGVMKQTTNLDNEILSLKSPDLMTEVVTSLGLNSIYSVDKGLREQEIYRESPVLVNPVDSVMPDVYSFDMRVKKDGSFTLSDFKIADQEVAGTATGRVGTPVKTPVGTVTLEGAPWASGRYGQTIHYLHVPAEGLGEGMAAGLGVSVATEKGSVLAITTSATSVRKADDILLTLIRIYNDRWLLDRNQIAMATSQFIDERLGVIESELGNVDSDISSYKSANLIPDVSAVSSTYFSQSLENQQAINEINTQISIARMIRNELSTESLEKTLPADLGLENSSVAGQIGEYNEMVLRRNRILAGSSERNPVVQDLTQSLQMMKGNIFQSIDNYMATLNARLGSFRRQEAHTTGKLAASPNQAKYLLSVERQQKVKEALYLFLLQKREENELSQAFTAYNSKIVNRPNGSLRPTYPVRAQIYMIAFVLGLAFPAGIIVLRMLTNNVVRGRKDLEELTIPFVAEIPEERKLTDKKATRKDKDKDKDKDKGSRDNGGRRLTSEALVVTPGSRDIINEAFRVARTNLSLMGGKDKAQNVVLFTSFNPGSGKSFISLNLAASYGIKGKRVLLIDGDLRKASLSKSIDAPRHGLTQYLAGETDDYASLVVRTPAEGVDLLPVGIRPPNPTELLENGRLEALVAQARKDYDYVFIDAVPIDIVADTQILAPIADRVVFIVRAGLLERAMLSRLQDIYDERRFPNLCVVLNGTSDGGASGYGYRYGYRYGYSYGYGAKGYYGDSQDAKS